MVGLRPTPWNIVEDNHRGADNEPTYSEYNSKSLNIIIISSWFWFGIAPECKSMASSSGCIRVRHVDESLSPSAKGATSHQQRHSSAKNIRRHDVWLFRHYVSHFIRC